MSDQNNKFPKIPKGQIPKGKQGFNVSWLIIFLIVFLLGQYIFSNNSSSDETANMQTDELTTSQFVQAVNENRVDDVTFAVRSNIASGVYQPAVTAGSSVSVALNSGMKALNTAVASYQNTATGTAARGISVNDLEIKALGSKHKYKAEYVGQDSLNELMAAHPNIEYKTQLPTLIDTVMENAPMILLLIGLLVGLYYVTTKASNQQLSFGKTRAKKATEERPDVKFDDVAGVDAAVEEMREIKDFLANPKKYQDMGAKIPRGCLLVGPPGTGKTLLAKAVAGEAGVPFFSISGSDFVEMFVGVGASRVRDLFKQAKEAAPSIIFIDEIDAVGRQRGTGLGGGHDEREQTLNQLLVEMDGFDKNESVVLIAATNRPDVLDPALLRPGRFDRQIQVDSPDVKGREKILEVHSADKPLGSDVDLKRVARLTAGFSGADLMNLMNESALLTARRGKRIITMAEVNDSLDRVIAGPEHRGRVIDEITKRTIAFHESGHALVGHLLEHADPVHKITIIPRGRALGYTMSIPQEDKVLVSRNQIYDELAVFLGGRVAEEIFCDDITTGASNDLERATKMARAMVTQYGMSSNMGTQVFGQPNHEVFLGRDYGNTQDYSDDTAKRIDEEVAKVMKDAHDRAYSILYNNRAQIELMVSVLMDRETVDGEACEALLNNTWDDYLEHEDEIIAMHEREEAEARKKDEEIYGPQDEDATDDTASNGEDGSADKTVLDTADTEVVDNGNTVPFANAVPDVSPAAPVSTPSVPSNNSADTATESAPLNTSAETPAVVPVGTSKRIPVGSSSPSSAGAHAAVNPSVPVSGNAVPPITPSEGSASQKRASAPVNTEKSPVDTAPVKTVHTSSFVVPGATLPKVEVLNEEVSTHHKVQVPQVISVQVPEVQSEKPAKKQEVSERIPVGMSVHANKIHPAQGKEATAKRKTQPIRFADSQDDGRRASVEKQKKKDKKKDKQ